MLFAKFRLPNTYETFGLLFGPIAIIYQQEQCLLIIAVMKQANQSHLVLLGNSRQHGNTASARNSKTTANVMSV